jgi:hypothetical protein
MKSKILKPVVPIMFDGEMKKKIEMAAKKEGRTFAGQVRHILTKWLEVTALFVFVGCSNPVKPAPEGICILEKVEYFGPGPMVIDTTVTCAECNKMASSGYYRVASWTESIQ